jgi:hypothetical protein
MLDHVAPVRTDVSEDCWFLQEAHGVIPEDDILHTHRHENLKISRVIQSLIDESFLLSTV